MVSIRETRVPRYYHSNATALNSILSIGPCARGVSRHYRIPAHQSSPSGFGTFLTASTSHTSLATTSTFDHGGRVPTTQGAGGYYLGVEQCHRSLKPREGLEFPTSQGRLWLCQHSSYTDQGMFAALLGRFTPGSHLTRMSRWLTTRITLNSGYPAPMSVELLTGG
jgi:hypothetical protein